MATQKTPKKTNTAKAQSKAPAKASAAKTAKKAAVKKTAPKVVAPAAGVSKSSKLSPFAALRSWNIRLGVLLILQAAAIVVLAKGGKQAVTTQFLSVDPLATEAAGHQVLAQASRHLFDLPLAWVVAAFLLLLAAMHIVVATVYRAQYEAALDRGTSRARWLGLGLSAGVSTVAVALLSGIHSVEFLLVLAVSTVLGCLLVYARETLFAGNSKRLMSHFLCGVGVVGIVAPWVVFALGVSGALAYDGTIPIYMYGIYTTGIVAFLIGLDMTHRRLVQSGRFIDSLFTEKAYMVFGFLVFSAMAWQIYAGVLAS